MGIDYVAIAKETLERIRSTPIVETETNKSKEPSEPVYFAKIRDRRAQELIKAGVESETAKEQAQKEIIDFYEKIQRGKTIRSKYWYPASEEKSLSVVK